METYCGCGCGGVVRFKELVPSQLRLRGPKRYLPGHQNRGRKHTPEIIAKTRHPLEQNGKWNGGRTTDKGGYIKIKCPTHPCARKSGYVLEHRLVMERLLGRYLTNHELVHHINGVKNDNRPENLMLVTPHQHMKVEREGKKFPRSNGVWFICATCGRKFYRSNYWRNHPVKWCSRNCRYQKEPHI